MFKVPSLNLLLKSVVNLYTNCTQLCLSAGGEVLSPCIINAHHLVSQSVCVELLVGDNFIE